MRQVSYSAWRVNWDIMSGGSGFVAQVGGGAAFFQVLQGFVDSADCCLEGHVALEGDADAVGG